MKHGERIIQPSVSTYKITVIIQINHLNQGHIMPRIQKRVISLAG